MFPFLPAPAGPPWSVGCHNDERPGSLRFMAESKIEHYALSTWPDDVLLTQWRCSDQAFGDFLADALSAEIQRRGLDF